MTDHDPADGPGRTPGVVSPADRDRGRAALAALVGDVESFLTDHWARRPLLTRATSPTASTDLLSIAAVDSLLAERGQRLPTVRLVRGGETIPTARFTTTARIGSQQVADLLDAGRIQAEFAAGATISLQGLQRYWPPLTELCRSLESFLTHPFQANAYLSPAAAQGLRVHHDTHDVFVVQVDGSKHFDVYEPAVELPVSGQHWASDDAPGETVISVDLQPGDCLYMPRGWRHRAYTTASHSLHLTVGLLAHTWLGLGSAVSALMADELEFRRPLPAGFAHDPDAFAVDVAARLKALARWVDELDPAALAGELARRFVTGRPAPAAGGLTRLVDGSEITADTPVRRRTGLPCLLRHAADRVELVLPDRTVSFPAYAGPVLRVLLDGDVTSAATLPDALGVRSRTVVVRRLVAEGLLEPA